MNANWKNCYTAVDNYMKASEQFPMFSKNTLGLLLDGHKGTIFSREGAAANLWFLTLAGKKSSDRY